MQKQVEKKKPFLTQETNAWEFAKFEFDLLLVMNEDGSDKFLTGEVSSNFKDLEKEPIFCWQLSEGDETIDSFTHGREPKVNLEKELTKETATPTGDVPMGDGFIISSPGAEGYKKAERMRTTTHSSEYFGYLKDHETRLYKYQLRKEKHETKVQTALIQLRSMIDDKVLKGLRTEMMLRDVKILYEAIKQKYGPTDEREGLEIISREYDQLIKAKSEDLDQFLIRFDEIADQFSFYKGQEKSDLDRRMKILSALRSESFNNYREWEVVIRRGDEERWDWSTMKKKLRVRASQLKVSEHFSQEYQSEQQINRAMLARNSTQAEREECKSEGKLDTIMEERERKHVYTEAETAAYRLRRKQLAEAWTEKKAMLSCFTCLRKGHFKGDQECKGRSDRPSLLQEEVLVATAPNNDDDEEPEWLRTECCSCVQEVVGKPRKISYSAEETSAFRLRNKQRAATWREKKQHLICFDCLRQGHFKGDTECQGRRDHYSLAEISVEDDEEDDEEDETQWFINESCGDDDVGSEKECLLNLLSAGQATEREGLSSHMDAATIEGIASLIGRSTDGDTEDLFQGCGGHAVTRSGVTLSSDRLEEDCVHSCEQSFVFYAWMFVCIGWSFLDFGMESDNGAAVGGCSPDQTRRSWWNLRGALSDNILQPGIATVIWLIGSGMLIAEELAERFRLSSRR